MYRKFGLKTNLLPVSTYLKQINEQTLNNFSNIYCLHIRGSQIDRPVETLHWRAQSTGEYRKWFLVLSISGYAERVAIVWPLQSADWMLIRILPNIQFHSLETSKWNQISLSRYRLLSFDFSVWWTFLINRFKDSAERRGSPMKTFKGKLSRLALPAFQWN